MGGSYNDEGLQFTIPTPASGSRTDTVYEYHGSVKGCCTGQGAGSAPGEVRYRSRRPSTMGSRILFNILPDSQEDWGLTAHTRPQGLKQVSKGSSVQDAYGDRGSEVDPARGMVHVGGPQGCILSCANCPKASAVSPFCLQGTPLAVQGTPLRTVTSPKDFYQMHGGCTSTFACKGPQDLAVSRRLVDLFQDTGRGDKPDDTTAGTCSLVGAEGEPAKERFMSAPEDGFHWHHPRLRSYGCQTDAEESRQHSESYSKISEGDRTSVGGVHALAGQADISDNGGPIRTSPDEDSTALAQWRRLGYQAGPPQKGYGRSTMDDGDRAMEEPVIPIGRSSNGDCAMPTRGGDYRCQQDRLGCSLAAENSQGSVDGGRWQGPYQCVRVESSTSSSEPVSAIHKEPTCVGSHRQHYSGVLYQPPRRGSICSTVTGGTQTVALGGISAQESTCNLSARSGECGGRLSVTTQAPVGRMEITPTGSAANLGKVRSSISGPFCDRGQHSMSPVVFMDAGRLGTGLATGVAVRVPTSSVDMANTSTGEAGGPQIVAGSTPMDGTAVVSPVAGVDSGTTMAAPSQEGPTVTDGRSDMASQSGSVEVNSLAGRPRPAGLDAYSPRVQETLIAARAPTTRVQYDNKWKLFTQWCGERGECPQTCSLSVILSFLQFLLEAGRAPSTLRVYAAAMSLYHDPVDGGTVGGHKSVTLFLRGAQRLRPRQAVTVAKWDLHMVLDDLCHPPYEPMASADLKWTSIKTAFLMAITSAKRVGELHALSISNSCLSWSPDGNAVELRPNASFLPKVLPQSHANAPVTFVKFQNAQGEPQGKAELCPVRAIKIYIAATREIRQNQQFFVCYGGDKRGQPLSKQRLSHWITEVIREAYTRAGRELPPGVKAHSTRAVSTSWAALRGVPLEKICAAANWSTPGTFTRFYRVNVADPSPLNTVIRTAQQ